MTAQVGTEKRGEGQGAKTKKRSRSMNEEKSLEGGRFRDNKRTIRGVERKKCMGRHVWRHINSGGWRVVLDKSYDYFFTAKDSGCTECIRVNIWIDTVPRQKGKEK